MNKHQILKIKANFSKAYNEDRNKFQFRDFVLYALIKGTPLNKVTHSMESVKFLQLVSGLNSLFKKDGVLIAENYSYVFSPFVDNKDDLEVVIGYLKEAWLDLNLSSDYFSFV